MKKLVLRYFSPAENTNDGWERYSLPLGNGKFGASVFGGTDVERVQFTTNEFANDYNLGGVSNFAELYVKFGYNNVDNYERGLDLSNGVAYSNFCMNGNNVKRSAFFSYPDDVFVYNVQSDKKIAFEVLLEIPYLNSRTVEQGGRTGDVYLQEQTVVMRGTLPFRNLIFEGRVAVVTDGQVVETGNKLCVKNATSSVLYFVAGTSYKLCEEMFFDGNHKALGDDPHNNVVSTLNNALSLGYQKLWDNFQTDYHNLMDRVTFDIGGKDEGKSTEELLRLYQSGADVYYLEELYYAYGRYLLVCSSRKGGLPSSLQGVWTVHDKSPWGSGFWHNINVQMNYWHAFSTNLAETFEAYVDFNKAYYKQAQIHARNWISQISNGEANQDCGWIIGTGAYAYEIEGMNVNTHSGCGTGGMTAKMFWDYYDFTRDKNILKDVTFPVIHGMAKFLTKCVQKFDDRYLCLNSASPEQIIGGVWVNSNERQQYYHTVGCAFDQQFAYENALDDLECARLLNFSDDVTKAEQEQLNKYCPVQIGYSGQIKEYDEENFYGEIGEAHHRHISQLVGLVPARSINHKTPAWLDSAKLTLQMRGDESTGWALAHRLCAWARTGDGNHCYKLLRNLLEKRTYPNLWDVHPPFQIDGNFGATAGITEMLLQSHEGYVSLFPAVPTTWSDVKFSGLKARGNFTVSAQWKDGKTAYCEITSCVGEKLQIKVPDDIVNVVVLSKDNGKRIDVQKADGMLTFDTKVGETYVLQYFEKTKPTKQVFDLSAVWQSNCVKLSWKTDAQRCAVYRAKDNDSDYSLLAVTTDCTFEDVDFSSNNKKRLTYKVVDAEGSFDSASIGESVTLHPASDLEVERYKCLFRQNNLNSK